MPPGHSSSQISITSLMLKVLGGISAIALTGLIGWMSSMETRISALAELSRGVQQEQRNLHDSNAELKIAINKMNDTVNQISVGIAALQRDVAHLAKKVDEK